MNNKGQSLVLFVIILPIVILLFVYLFDLANLTGEKIKLDNIAKQSITYLKEDKDINIIKNYIIKNDKEIKVINIDDNEIHLEKEVPSIFGKNIGFKSYKIEIHKKG